MSTQRYPLDWPQGYPRTQWKENPRFKTIGLGQAVQSVIEQVRLLKGKYRLEEGEVIISSNVTLRNDGLPRADYMRTAISDTGVSVYFTHNKDKVVLCCDRWRKVEDNVKAIAVTIEDIRRIERNGVSDFIKRSFTGFKALPEGAKEEPWYIVIGFSELPAKDFKNPTLAKTMYREKLFTAHPDHGGSNNDLIRLQNAWEQAQKYFNL